jgi:hypothetical protein
MVLLAKGVADAAGGALCGTAVNQFVVFDGVRDQPPRLEKGEEIALCSVSGLLTCNE